MDISKARYKKIQSLANICRNLFDTTDPFKICKLLDIKIRYISLSNGIWGFSNIWSSDGSNISIFQNKIYPIHATIFLSSKLDKYSQKIVCAHELGHVLLHNKERLNLFDIKDQADSFTEYEANIFAIELLPQIYHCANRDYRLPNRCDLYYYMNKKIATAYFTF